MPDKIKTPNTATLSDGFAQVFPLAKPRCCKKSCAL